MAVKFKNGRRCEEQVSSTYSIGQFHFVLCIMDLIRSYYYASTKPELLNALIFTEAFFTLPFVICSFVVASTANAGFNCVLTGMLNVGLAAGSYYVLKTSKAPLAVSLLHVAAHIQHIHTDLSFPFLSADRVLAWMFRNDDNH
jgi:hypothetical protein